MKGSEDRYSTTFSQKLHQLELDLSTMAMMTGVGQLHLLPGADLPVDDRL
jgi:hypothetical protein